MSWRLMKKILFLLIVVGLHLFVLTRLRFEVWPEMVLAPYLMNHGYVLYKDVVVPYTPILLEFLKYWFMAIGLSIFKLKVLTWMIIIGIDVLVYFTSFKKYGERAARFCLIFFVLLQPVFDGNGLWFDLAVTPLLLGAYYFNNSFLISLALMTKQSVIWLLPLWRKQLGMVTKFTIGFGLLFSIYYAKIGAIRDFWFWAIYYPFRWLPFMPGHKDFGGLRLWTLALLPWALIIGFCGFYKRSFRWLFDRNVPLSWAVWLLPLTLPRFGLFHFQPALAFLALEVGRLYKNKNYKDYKSYKVYFGLGAMAVYLVFFWQRTIVFQWGKLDRFLEPEVYELAARVAVESKIDKPLLLVNSPELVYFLSNRLPPKPWVTQFPWYLELPGYQERLIGDFRNQNLTQIVFTPYMNKGEFIPGSYQPKKLLEYLQFEAAVR